MKDTNKIKVAYYIRRYEIALNDGREKEAQEWLAKLDTIKTKV